MVKNHKTTSDIMVFDRLLVQKNRQRALNNFNNYDFLFEWSKNQLSERLYDINRSFDLALQIGSRAAFTNSEHDKIKRLITCDLTSQPFTNNAPNYIQSSEEFLPIAPQSMDLISSNLNLHSVNDLPGALLQIKNSLKKDGLFTASMLGGETLHELRTTLTNTELSLTGGVSPRIFPFADKKQMGDLLQRAGFALPVIDSEIITVTYESFFKLLHDLRGMGENNAILQRNKIPVSKNFFMHAARKYHEKYAQNDGRITASFEVIFLIGWSPHESQQKPLRPGSAKHRLADILDTDEVTTGEKSTP